MRMVDTQAFLDAVCQMISQGAEAVAVPIAGTSMTPFLYPGDTAYLSAAAEPLKKGDIVLYQRPGGRYILHRIVKVKKDGSFLTQGDSQLEAEPVSRDRIRAKAVRVCRRGKQLSPGSREWELFARGWVQLTPIRGPILRMRQRMKGKKAPLPREEAQDR